MKAGDYVRTDDGCICKVLQYTEISDTDFYVNTDSPYNVIYKSWIVKSSPNIIDLIEVGDYVNGIKVDFTNIDNKLTYEDTCIGFYDGDGDITLFANDIKSIVTKEKFANAEYRVETN